MGGEVKPYRDGLTNGSAVILIARMNKKERGYEKKKVKDR
jgi:hypothetical protein